MLRGCSGITGLWQVVSSCLVLDLMRGLNNQGLLRNGQLIGSHMWPALRVQTQVS